MQEFNDIIKSKEYKITLSEMRELVYEIEKVNKNLLAEKEKEILTLSTLLISKEKFYLNELDKVKQKSKLEFDKLYKQIQNIEN